jgi:NAD+ synthase
MIKDVELLVKTLLDFIKTNSVVFKKQGIIIHLDGTLMSVVNVALAKRLGAPFTFKVVTCMFNNNKLYLAHILSLAKVLEVETELKDLTRDLEQLSLYSNAGQQVDLEIAIKKRLVDFTMNVEADRYNLIPVSNQSYSQWCIEFPHKNYQTLDQLHILNRLFFSEVQQLARHLNIADNIVDREPSHYLYKGYGDRQALGFSYEELEEALRGDHSNIKSAIKERLTADNRNRYICPAIQRPSSIIG